MQNVTLIGIDLRKHSFYIHCQDKSDKALLSKVLIRTKLIDFSASPSSTMIVMACLCLLRI